eukprot:TRINITY_DN9563_c0_g1_i1.p1 TRINITY_DN9563_c0_g1~~TRINITY_DN9563_c0_g1_i1.p1  ORF type:complete len:186 (-),score=17.46 TRINITY_DN9563_c0_g1_i1:370-927(-)
MLGCIVSGRLVQTSPQQVDVNRFVFAIEQANQIHHLCIFLLGTVPIPEGYGASIFFGWPPYQDWKFLGHITNSKPSAVFRLRSKTNGSFGIDVDMDKFDGNIIAQIGISIEPMEVIEKRMTENLPRGGADASTSVAGMQEFASKMCNSLYNYLTSFNTSIPTNIMTQWLENFQRKLKNDPYFWKS